MLHNGLYATVSTLSINRILKSINNPINIEASGVMNKVKGMASSISISFGLNQMK
jgi:hypothetical protein